MEASHTAASGSERRFHHPSCSSAACELLADASAAICSRCDISFPVTHGILEIVDRSTLDEEKRRELDGNTFSLDQETVDHFLRKQDWNRLLTAWANRRLRTIVSYSRQGNV